jgi:hypothetical protein
MGNYPELENFNLDSSEGYRGYVILRTILSDAIEQGVVVKDTPEKIAQIVWAQIFGLTSLMVIRKNFPWYDDQDKIISNYIAIIIRSISK